MPDNTAAVPAQPRLKPGAAVQYVKGIGPVRAEALQQIGITTVSDLLYNFPRRYLDRRNVQPISDLKIGVEATVLGKVIGQGARQTKRRRVYQVTIQDDSGVLSCVWFRGGDWIRDKFKTGDRVAVSGRVEYYRHLQMVHPDFDLLDEGDDPLHTGKIVPLYPGSADLRARGLDSRRLRRIMHGLWDRLDTLPDHFAAPFREEYGLPELALALRQLHEPDSAEALETAIHRLKFDEHFFLQLLMALRRRALQAQEGRKFPERGPLVEQIYRALPFELTGAQIRVLRELRSDFQSGRVMNRLLQGDVGSGKTVVALMAAAIVASAGAQTAVMAPTEILAEQHYRAFGGLSRDTGMKIALLTGSTAQDRRDSILSDLRDGQLDLIIGTHALIQETVTFHDLAFIVVDEQHRFGVMQRGKLVEKGITPHLLAMTATPIPRTLAITYHGDMDVSLLDELPRNRAGVETSVLSADQLPEAYAMIRAAAAAGQQSFIVYPVIDDSEQGDLQAARSAFKELQAGPLNGLQLAYLDGRLSGEEKERVMAGFTSGATDVLVSTTVVEVGIDVPNATLMLVENAERFGLTQLHQLRGRIGRGGLPGRCLLIQRSGAEEAEERLAILVATTDGFEIADADLKLRGPGQLFGPRQHGFERMRLGNLVTDGEIIRVARAAAFELAEKDQHLAQREHRPLKKVLMSRYRDQLEFVTVK